MRQFLTLRFWLALGALGGLALALVLLFHRSTPTAATDAATGAPATERHIDLVSWVYQAYPQPGFAVRDGVATADLSLQLDGTRTMVIKAGTPGEQNCPALDQPAQCTVAADLLGDAVLWFGLVPGKPGSTVVLPAVMEMVDSPWVRLANGWVVRRASRVERVCPADTSSFADFIRTYGASATSTFNFDSQKIVRVTCSGDGVVDSVPPSTGPATSVIVGTETDDSAGLAPTSTALTSVPSTAP